MDLLFPENHHDITLFSLQSLGKAEIDINIYCLIEVFYYEKYFADISVINLCNISLFKLIFCRLVRMYFTCISAIWFVKMLLLIKQAHASVKTVDSQGLGLNPLSGHPLFS